MTKGKDAKKKPAAVTPKGSPASATSKSGTINMLTQQPSKKKKQYN